MNILAFKPRVGPETFNYLFLYMVLYFLSMIVRFFSRFNISLSSLYPGLYRSNARYLEKYKRDPFKQPRWVLRKFKTFHLYLLKAFQNLKALIAFVKLANT
jgi:hypothetical protein